MMSKSIYEEALELLDIDYDSDQAFNTYKKALEQARRQEQEHIEYSKKVKEQFSNDTKRIGELESKFIIQEKLLELYKELSFIRLLLSAEFEPDEELRLMNKVDKILKQIEELEK